MWSDSMDPLFHSEITVFSCSNGSPSIASVVSRINDCFSRIFSICTPYCFGVHFNVRQRINLRYILDEAIRKIDGIVNYEYVEEIGLVRNSIVVDCDHFFEN